MMHMMFFFELQWPISLILLVCSSSLQADSQCHPWSFYNDTLHRCQCYESLSMLAYDPGYDIPNAYIVECSERKVSIHAGFCMTVDKVGTFVAFWPSYLLNKNVTLVDGSRYIQLPDNISELNDYMCGPMNRKGRVCGECIDGFAPSVTSMENECSNCTGAWYGIPLYLFLELAPITIFYLTILVFQISVTSSPMAFCVMYSQIVVLSFSMPTYDMIIIKSSRKYTFIKIALTLHGVWNLDFFRYIVPPFCVSPFLKNIHVTFLGYISAAYPLLLIFLTWISVQLYSHNYQPFVWLWSKLSCLKPSRYSKTTIVDIFATFFFLSYTKLCFLSALILRQSLVHQANGTYSYAVMTIEPSIHYFSREHAPYAIVAALILFVFGLLPAVLLAAYPIRKLRSLFLIDHLSGRSKAALNIFVERFYSCYRDGLDGGRDMRSFASLHLWIRLLALLMCIWTYPTILFGSCCLLILLVRPCKKSYMNNIDAVILALLTLGSFQADKVRSGSMYSDFYIWSSMGIAFLPLFVYIHLIPHKYLTKMKEKATNFSIFRRLCCLKDNKEKQGRELTDNAVSDPVRLVHPHQYPEGADSESHALLHGSNCVPNQVYLGIN